MIKGLGEAAKSKKRSTPLWEGPSGKGDQGGVTFSMLSRFLQCRERFRLYAVEGLRAQEEFNHRLEYGNSWHLCEEVLAGVNTDGGYQIGKPDVWEPDLLIHTKELCEKFPTQQEQIDHWYNVVKTTFPIYVDYWSKHRDTATRTPLMQEQVFDVQYVLPSGRVVRLRGKYDSVDIINKGIWLFETKTKGEIDVEQIERQMTFDLQTLLYLVSLEALKEQTSEKFKKVPIQGVRYNIVRRPLSGGKGTIIRHKATAGSKCPKCDTTGMIGTTRCPKCNGMGRTGGKPEETKEDYYTRVGDYIREEPGSYFARFNVTVTPQDIARFRRECLDPILEHLCDWWEWITSEYGRKDPFWGLEGTKRIYQGLHWRHPYGVLNSLDGGYTTEMDQHLATGSLVGLHPVETLFRELN